MRFIAVTLVACYCLTGCNESPFGQQKTKDEKRREESAEKNPVKKGRYNCWYEQGGKREQAPYFYILSNNMYQVDEQPGRYRFNTANNSLQFMDGPYAAEPALTAKYVVQTPAKNIDSLGEPMIEFKRSDQSFLRCSCSLFQY